MSQETDNAFGGVGDSDNAAVTELYRIVICMLTKCIRGSQSRACAVLNGFGYLGTVKVIAHFRDL